MASWQLSFMGSHELDGAAFIRRGPSCGSVSSQLAALSDAAETWLDASGRAALVLRAGAFPGRAGGVRALSGTAPIARGFGAGRLPVRAGRLPRQHRVAANREWGDLFSAGVPVLAARGA